MSLRRNLTGTAGASTLSAPCVCAWPELIQALLGWYDRCGRSLPWREPPLNTYRIWVSEIMLQQTRVETVVPYYQRFVHRFPDLATLALASLDEVLLLWEGLGYYARARHLHRCARQLVAAGHRQPPGSYDALRRLPGIGPYTAAAIASIATGEPRPAIDGNLRRVFSRLLGGPVASLGPAQASRTLQGLLTPLWPRQRAGDLNQAAMDLAATICLPRQPRCSVCPLCRWCSACNGTTPAAGAATRQLPATVVAEARASGLPLAQIPFGTSFASASPGTPALPATPGTSPVSAPSRGQARSRPLPRLTLAVLIVVRGGQSPQLLCRRRQEDGLFGGLWEFPTLPYRPGFPFGHPHQRRWLWRTLPARRQRLTHRLLELHPFLVMGPPREPSSGPPSHRPAPPRPFAWFTLAQLARLPLPHTLRELARSLPALLATDGQDSAPSPPLLLPGQDGLAQPQRERARSPGTHERAV